MIDRGAYERDGYALLRSFATRAEVDELLAPAVEFARKLAAGEPVGAGFTTPEANLADRVPERAEQGVSKLFRVHRLDPFEKFATDNGCLYVVPGSNHESVHQHIPDRRPNANYGYYEIVDHDLSDAIAVEMEPGDVLVFDGHLMHFSNDNTSSRWRAAMVYHYALAGTIDHTEEQRGYTIHDWMPARRGS